MAQLVREMRSQASRGEHTYVTQDDLMPRQHASTVACARTSPNSVVVCALGTARLVLRKSSLSRQEWALADGVVVVKRRYERRAAAASEPRSTMAASV